MPHVHSDLDYGIGDSADRPPGIPVSYSPSMLCLTSYMSERMGIAVTLLGGGASAWSCRKRLCRFFCDTSAEAYRLHAGPILDALLAAAPPFHYGAIGRWMDGRWDPDAIAMVDLLWRMQATPRVVAAAEHLHRRGADLDDESRNDAPGHTWRTTP